ncbi:glyoxalase [Haematobacter massiliensis]|uniref:Glyoxalase n=1 Tax=Haematobacter massiliensis TaxID=195105 RepID=A0A086Y6Q8_9RHOB|nr:hypothetical protein [Haematobacter massiliensis]KFI29958.1 glyoxalase [Haematobacter massiliensis]OWJ86897.1 glyoxalase [Haematobacter massiliensis]QBJ25465.1 glyoxalase [Haematobacter massiliensis]
MPAPLVFRLGYVALNVTDPEAAAKDTCNIAGARISAREGERIMLTSNQRRAEMILYPAATNTLRRVGLEAVTPEAVDEVAVRARKAGLKILTDRPSLDCISKGVTFLTSEGHAIEVHTPMPLDQPLRYHGPGVHPRFLDHVNFAARDPVTFSQELHAATGMLLTERTSGYEIMWMRAADGRHHTLAAVKGNTGVHHISWEFKNFDGLKGIADELGVENRRLLWGPGRHGAGDNLFLYYVDRSGFLIECIAEMEVIQDLDLPTRVADPGENLSNWRVVNQWGALPSLEWIQHFTACCGVDEHDDLLLLA